jgi:hypothetical protein
MSPRKPNSLDQAGSPQDWLAHAKSDLGIAVLAIEQM